MTKRSITDEEISLIKAMCATGMKKKDIQFFFNTPSRPVNSGRISDIGNGKYSDSSTIEAASSEILKTFLESKTISQDVPSVMVSTLEQPNSAAIHSPTSAATIRAMFSKDNKGIWRLTDGETDHTECKENFGLKHTGPWMRAMAALSNNKGGYIFFGIRDKDADGSGVHAVIGLTSEEFEKADPVEIAKRVKSTFAPTPIFWKGMVEIGGIKVGVIYVESHPSRPVIATKNDDKVQEGDIFYRYPGTSTRINYSDLRALLDARDEQVRAAILPMVERLLSLGPDRAMIADLVEGELVDGQRTVKIDTSLIDRLTFIKEGEFVEKYGAPTLRLVGNVEVTGTASMPPVKKGIVTQPEMLYDFLTDTMRAEPSDYLRLALEGAHTGWLPVRHFGKAAGMTIKDLLAFVANSSATPAQKALYTKRLSSTDKAHVVPKGPVTQALKQLLAGHDFDTSDPKQVRQAALAVQALERPLKVDASKLKALLLKCLETCAKGSDDFNKTAVRKAVARLDELLNG